MIEVEQDLWRSSGQTSSSKREFRPGCSGLVVFGFGVFSLFFALVSEASGGRALCLHFHVTLQTPGNPPSFCKLRCPAAFWSHQNGLVKGWIKLIFCERWLYLSAGRRDPDFLPSCPPVCGIWVLASLQRKMDIPGRRVQQPALLSANWPLLGSFIKDVGE